jgi:SWIM zinc finger
VGVGRPVYGSAVDIRWTAEQVTALAPDASSVASGRKLSGPASWSALGAAAEPAAVWGLCRGSGKSPYRTAVDLGGPAFSCSCPSRKFPCKHALGLLLLWSAGGVPEVAEAADWVGVWLVSRLDRASRAQARAGRAATDGRAVAGGPGAAGADPEAGARRVRRREQRRASGLVELEQWLRDQVREGLAATPRGGYAAFDAVAARMVDAQLPGVASALRRLASTAASGEGWPGRMLEEYGLLHLLAVSGRSLFSTPGDGAGDGSAPEAGTGVGPAADGAAAVLSARVGVTVSREEVLARPAVRDRWAVLGMRDEVEERLTVRRVWLRGEGSGRTALVLSFAMAGQLLDTSLRLGTAVPADLHFYPGRGQLRAAVGERVGPAGPPGPFEGAGWGEALQGWARALADDPWITGWPVVIRDALPVSQGQRWWLVCGDEAMPLLGPAESAWTLAALSGGRPTQVLADVVPGGARVISALGPGDPDEGLRVVPL